MPLLKDDKKKVAKQYLAAIQWAKNVVIVRHEWIPVNELNAMRMDLADSEWSLQIVKKRVLIKSIEGEYAWSPLDEINWSVAILMSSNEEDQHAPLKVVQKHVKARKKAKEEYVIEYIWWWYDGNERMDATYVTELANLPSKEELVGKFLFMLNHPVSSFARVLKAIADKDGGAEEEQKEEEQKEEEQGE